MITPKTNKLEIIIENYPDLIMLVDAKNWHVHYLNEKMANSLGKHKEELVDKNILEFLPPDVASQRKKMAKTVIRTKAPVFFEDGRAGKWFRNSFYPIFNQKGEVIYGLVIVQDITKEKEIDKELEKSQEKYESLVNNLFDGVCTLDKHGNFIFVNDTIIKRSGISKEKWKHINIYDIVYQEYHKVVQNAIKQLFNGKQIGPFEVAYKSATGTKIITEVSARPYSENNKVMSIHAITRDITDKQKIENELIESEKKYRQLVNLFQDAVFTLDKDGKVTYINEIAEKRAGIPLSEWSNITFYKIALPGYNKIAQENIQKVLNGEQIAPFILAYQNKQNKKLYVELNIGPLRDSQDNIIGIHGISRDITDRQEALEDLRKSEEMYRTLLQTSPDPIVLTDLQGKIITVSEQSLKMFGAKSASELIGKNAFALIPPEELTKAKDLYKETLQNGFVQGFELKAYNKDKSLSYYEINTGLLKDTNGKPKAFFGIYRDITQRKLDAKKSRDSERKYRTIFDTSVSGIILTDKNAILTDVNPACVEIMGYDKPKELIGRPTKERYAFPEQRAPYLKELQEKGYLKNFEATYVRKDGSYIHCIGSLTYLKDDDGNIIGTLGSFLDITDKAIIQQEIRETKDYLQTVIDNTSDIIFVIGFDKKIKTWNKTAEKITGFKQRSLKGKTIQQSGIFIDSTELEGFVDQAFKGIPPKKDEIRLNTVDDAHRLISFSTSVFRGKGGKNPAVLFTAHDITEESSKHKRMKFGKCYLLLNDDVAEARFIFENLLENGVSGLYISRFSSYLQTLSNKSLDIDLAYLSRAPSNNVRDTYVESLDDLITLISTYIQNHRNAVVFIDRLDYLFTLFSFDKVLQAIYQLHDRVRIHHGIILFRLSKNIVTPSQQALLFEELHSLPEASSDSIEISGKLFDILQFIYDRSVMNEQVTFNSIEKFLPISKVTSRKRVNELRLLGLISVKKIGRGKLVQLTYGGRMLLQKRKTI